MKGICGGAAVVGTVLLTAWLAANPAGAEIADVYLRGGLRLRGDVTTTETEIVLRNAAGEVRLARADVERITPVPTAATQPTSAAARERSTSGQSTTRPARLAKESETARPPELPPAPLLSNLDVQRLKMHELMLDGPAEQLRVRFLRKGRERDMAAEVLDAARRRPDFQPAWEETLTRGQPYEKLQLIVRLTGATHASRVVIESDPEVFDTYRRRVLPLVAKSCGRSGCHAGRSAQEFRFPLGSSTNDAYVYTTFVLLDQMQTAQGPLLNRDRPADSALLSYLMPQENNPRGHPAVSLGPAFKPAILRSGDAAYESLRDWIGMLVLPRPDYGLDYEKPYGAAREATEPADE